MLRRSRNIKTFGGDEAMFFVIQGLQFLLAIGSLVCFIMVLIKMFQSGEQTMGIVCIVLAFCGIGFLVAFIYGWINVTKWNIKNVMWIWTGIVIASLVLSVIGLAAGATMFPVQK
jgi:hypothetical protein